MGQNTHHFVISYIHTALAIYALGITIYGLGQQSKVRGSYLARNDGNTMLFRKPLPVRRVTLAIVGFFVLLFANALAIALEDRNPLPFYFASATTLGLLVLFLYMSGPDDIRLDGSQHTYEQTVGWPWKPTTRSGSFSGIEGLCISPRNAVLLLLEQPGPLSNGVVLSSSGTKVAAETLVEDLKREYGFAVVPYPKK